MPLLSFERANQWVPLDFMLKTDKMKLPLHEFSFVKATAPSFKKNGLDYQNIVIFAGYNIDSLSLMKSLIP